MHLPPRNGQVGLQVLLHSSTKHRFTTGRSLVTKQQAALTNQDSWCPWPALPARCSWDHKGCPGIWTDDQGREAVLRSVFSCFLLSFWRRGFYLTVSSKIIKNPYLKEYDMILCGKVFFLLGLQGWGSFACFSKESKRANESNEVKPPNPNNTYEATARIC